LSAYTGLAWPSPVITTKFYRDRH